MILQPLLVSLEHPSGPDNFCALSCKSPGWVWSLSPTAEHTLLFLSQRTSSPCYVLLQFVLLEGTAPQTSPGWISLSQAVRTRPWGLPTLISACRSTFLQMVHPEFPIPAKSRKVLKRNKEKICLVRLRNHLIVQKTGNRWP